MADLSTGATFPNAKVVEMDTGACNSICSTQPPETPSPSNSSPIWLKQPTNNSNHAEACFPSSM